MQHVEEIALLKKQDMLRIKHLFEVEGNTYAEIAITLGRENCCTYTRNQISGAIFRMRRDGVMKPSSLRDLRPGEIAGSVGARKTFGGRVARRAAKRPPSTAANAGKSLSAADRPSKIDPKSKAAPAEPVDKAIAAIFDNIENVDPAESFTWKPEGGKQLLPHERQCKWPFGDPRNDDFHYCCGARMVGRSYCAEHEAGKFRKSVGHKRTREEALVSRYEQRRLAEKVSGRREWREEQW